LALKKVYYIIPWRCGEWPHKDITEEKLKHKRKSDFWDSGYHKSSLWLNLHETMKRQQRSEFFNLYIYIEVFKSVNKNAAVYIDLL